MQSPHRDQVARLLHETQATNGVQQHLLMAALKAASAGTPEVADDEA
ncbi:MAG: hypothetical protein QOD07_3021 [Frankiaceae bacterium]|nr:hypothetical protein [Frankiaceae bacterium]